MTLPIRDPQFWIVTAIALAAALWLFRGFLPGRKKRQSQRRATLTIGGRPVDPP
jgi:hypothetical protein